MAYYCLSIFLEEEEDIFDKLYMCIIFKLNGCHIDPIKIFNLLTLLNID